jgi:hypothetical protein|tara:strand:- start:1757 stop:2569 length:813 start_codon:yes stop_codon:yes gene_type:complete
MAKKKVDTTVEEVVNPEGANLAPLLDRPERVAIVALGLSSPAFLRDNMSMMGMRSPFDEIWTLNRGVRGVAHDKLFCMDDFRWIEQKDENYARYLQNHDKPIITSTSYPEYPMGVEYPLNEVLECIQDDIFTANTVAYMVAYALYIGVKELAIYGADFCYPNGNFAESGGQSVAYLLGRAKEFGCWYKIPQGSTLLYSHKVVQVGNRLQRVYYGYHRKDEMAKAKEKGNGAQPIQAAPLQGGERPDSNGKAKSGSLPVPRGRGPDIHTGG